MKRTIISAGLLLLMASGSFAQNERSTHGHEHNPWYSNTDTTRLQVSNTEWKKILSADLYAVYKNAFITNKNKATPFGEFRISLLPF